MDDPQRQAARIGAFVDELQRIGHVDGHQSGDHRAGTLSAAARQRQHASEVLTVDGLECDVAGIAEDSEVEHPHDVGVRQGSGDASFLVKQLAKAFIARHLRQHALDHHGTMIAMFADKQRPEHFGGPADGQAVEQLVTAGERLAHPIVTEEIRQRRRCRRQLGRYCSASLALLLILGSAELAVARDRTLVLLAGDECGDPRIEQQLADVARSRGSEVLTSAQAAAVVARVRAARALERARELYLRTRFSGCVSLLSITEQELGRHLGETDAARMQRAHRLLAQVNLWLGVCQWSAGDPQPAAASFVRSAQLPSSPLPDPQLLPPRVLDAYRKAVAAPRQQVSCRLMAPLSTETLLVDGKGPTVMEKTVRVAAGTHYLVLGTCDDDSAACRRVSAELGGSSPRSLRLDARPLGCTVQLPAGSSPSRACINAKEAADPDFVRGLVQRSGAKLALVASVSSRDFQLRLLRRGSDGFVRQLHGAFESDGGSRSTTLRRSAGLLLTASRGVEPAGLRSRRRTDRAWYERWWVWAVVGAVVVGATATGVAVGAANGGRVKVVFGP